MLIVETSLPYTTIRRVLSELAAGVSEPVNISEIHRRTRVSPNTLRKLFAAFEAMFLIEMLPQHHAAGQPAVFFVDTGEANHLAQGRLSPEQVLNQSLFSDIKASLSHMTSISSSVHFSHFRTRGGTSIPIVLTIGGKSWGLVSTTPAITGQSILSQTQSFMNSPGAQGVISVPEHSQAILTRNLHLLEAPRHLVVI